MSVRLHCDKYTKDQDSGTGAENHTGLMLIRWLQIVSYYFYSQLFS